MNKGKAAHYVATVLTVYGIETSQKMNCRKQWTEKELQQYLPFTVLKPPHQIA